jgi:hypothetical protein
MGKTFDPGHFKQHNKAIVDELTKATDLHAAVKAYVGHAVADGLALVDAGASPEQMKASLQALADQFETAWSAMTANTGYHG